MGGMPSAEPLVRPRLPQGQHAPGGGALAAAVPSFTALSPPLGLDYFGVFDGGRGRSPGACSCRHLKERLHGAVARQVERELLAETPWFLIQGGVEGWWRTTMAEAFRAVVDEEPTVLGGASSGGPGVDVGGLGATALVALVLKEYIVLASCGVSRAVVCRGGVAVQLTSDSEHYRPNRLDEKESIEDAATGESTDDVLPPPGAFAHVTAEPEVRTVARYPRDEFLILATAGLWDHVSPAAACGHVARRLRATARPTRPTTRPTTPWVARMGSRGTPGVVAEELAEHAVRESEGGAASVVVVVLFRDLWADPADDDVPVVSSGRAQRARRPNTRYGPAI